MEYGVSEFVVQALPTTQPTMVSPREADRWNLHFGGGREVLSGIRVNHKSTIGYPPFWRGVNLLANDVADLPLDVFRRDGDDREIARTHPAQKLIKQAASPVMHARAFRSTMMGHALLFGNGFAWIERDQRSRPIALWVLDPQQMIVRYLDGELWYATVINGEQRKFPGRDIVHIAGLSSNGIVGYSAIDIMADALGVGMAAQQFGSRFFGDGANMSGLLMIPGHFQDDKIRNTLSAWKEMSSGMKNAHKVALLQDGVQFKQTTIPPDSAQFLETRNFEVRVTVANILGVPPHLLGDDTRTSHSSLEQENQSYLNHSLNPWLSVWEGEIERKLLSEREQDRDTHFVEFNREAAVQMMFKEKIEGIYRQVEMGQLTINESRKLVNLPDIGSDGDKRYHPANWLEVGKEPEEAPSAIDNNADTEEPTDDDESQSESALEAMIRASVDDAIEIEKTRVVNIAKRAKTMSAFTTNIERFYSTWETKTASGLDSPHAAIAKSQHADASMQAIAEVCGGATMDTITDHIADLVSDWDERGSKLATNLIKATK